MGLGLGTILDSFFKKASVKSEYWLSVGSVFRSPPIINGFLSFRIMELKVLMVFLVLFGGLYMLTMFTQNF